MFKEVAQSFCRISLINRQPLTFLRYWRYFLCGARCGHTVARNGPFPLGSMVARAARTFLSVPYHKTELETLAPLRSVRIWRPWLHSSLSGFGDLGSTPVAEAER